MARSGKSDLSPTITKPSNTSGSVDMGQKSQPSVTSGGIGISQEVANIGGVTVTGGVSVELSPIDLGVNYDPSENSVSVAAGAEIPGGFLGASGGVTIDLDTGEITGGNVGVEGVGLGVNISASKDGGLGVGITIQIPGSPVEIELGFGFSPEKKEPKPTPTPTPSNKMPPGWEPTLPTSLPPLNISPGLYYVRTTDVYADGSYYRDEGNGTTNYSVVPPQTGNLKDPIVAPPSEPEICINVTQQNINFSVVSSGSIVYYPGSSYQPIAYQMERETNRIEIFSPTRYMAPFGIIYGERKRYYRRVRIISDSHGYTIGTIVNNRSRLLFTWLYLENYGEGVFWEWMEWELIFSSTAELIKCREIPFSPPPPFPNPPPRKRNMDECCRESIKLARENRRFLQEVMLMMGRPLDARGNLIPVPPGANFFGKPIERIKTPIADISKPEKEKIVFANYYELQMYLLKQQINLDVAVDPQSFVAPEGKVQNPNYERNSETSLDSNVQPEKDQKGNKRELTIGEDIKINSIAQQQQYLFEALKRLEYLFPFGELADAKFDKSLIIPGATGELQIHNLIHFKEFLIQFLNSTLGNPKIPVKIEDNNALKDGKQEATFNHFSISQMIRELYRIVLESGDDINSLMETTIRDFRTNLANRIQIVQIAEMTQALVEDTGMLEEQVFIPLKLDGDPYAGKWKKGMGFEPDADLDSNTEAATEKLMRATLNNFEAQVKVIRRDKRENADTRDLLIQLAEMFIRSTSIPATKEGIGKAIEVARTKLRVDNAISRTQVKRAAAAKLSRTKRKK